MTHSFDSVPEDDPLIKSAFHHFLVAFAAPASWPAGIVILLAAGLAAGLGWLWAIAGGSLNNGLLIFLIQASFFVADRDLLASLPRRRISFASWQGQFFAIALPRTVVALALGLLVPLVGWRPAFYLNIAAQFVGTLALYRGAIIEPGRLSMSELTIHVSRLAAHARAVRILHVSDLHIERLSSRESDLLELMTVARPDFILITGDYVNLSFNIDPLTHGQVRELLAKLWAPGGVYAVLGSPAVDLPDVIPPLFEGLPVRLLRNELIDLVGPDGQALTLIGLECHHDIAADTATLDSLLAAAPEGKPQILIYHSPELMSQAVERGIDLYLCGHTHGGQVRLPLVGPLVTSSRLGRRYVMGHYHENRTHLYVSRGVGFEGLGAPRVRLFCPPEITLVTIEADSDGQSPD